MAVERHSAQHKQLQSFQITAIRSLRHYVVQGKLLALIQSGLKDQNNGVL